MQNGIPNISTAGRINTKVKCVSRKAGYKFLLISRVLPVSINIGWLRTNINSENGIGSFEMGHELAANKTLRS